MLYHPECCFRKFSLPNLRPLSPDRRQVRHHRLPGGAGHSPRHRGSLGQRGFGHLAAILRLYRVKYQGETHELRVHCPHRGQAAIAAQECRGSTILNNLRKSTACFHKKGTGCGFFYGVHIRWHCCGAKRPRLHLWGSCQPERAD